MQLELKAAKTAAAFLFFFRAAVSSAGVSTVGFGDFTTLFLAAMGLVYSPVNNTGGLTDEGEHLLVGGQVLDAGDAAEGTHAAALDDA